MYSSCQEQFMLTRVLVTGGAGFVGSNLIRRLLERDDVERIVSIDNYSSGFEKNHAEDDRVTYIRCNTWDIPDRTEEIGMEPTVIFHFGEFSRIVQSFDQPVDAVKSNAFGTFVVAKYAADLGAKLVYSGSTAIFGNDGADSNLNPYAWTKSNNIKLLHNMKAWFSLEFVICYFYNVFGPGQIDTGTYATVIGIFERQRVAGEPLTIVSPGSQTRAFTHVDDIVEGVILVALKGDGDDYLLGTTENLSISEVASMFGGSTKMISPRRGERTHSCILPSRARTELGWDTKHTLKHYVESLSNT